jgi:hypothetical protein
MPGRKDLFLISPVVGFLNISRNNYRYRDYRSEYSSRMNELADQALRTGVVINLLDIKGLTADPLARYSIENEFVLARKTGGITVKNSNFFIDGVGWAHEHMKGYYLISYVPPANTFKPKGRNKYHRIKLKVKRRFSEVYTRDGFFGGSTFAEGRPVRRKVLLQEAIFSPFIYDDLTLRMASGYASESENGYFLRSWMHLDGKDVTFIDEQDGGHAISLELATVTTDIGGMIQDSQMGTFECYVRNENVERAKKEGIGFDIYLPVEKPGAYYVRIAVKDQASEKIGTAYQFLEIPDLKKKRLSLSSIFVLNHENEISGFGLQNAGQSRREHDKVLAHKERRKSPAIRSYLPGEGFDYMVVVYNAKMKKKQSPELETQFVLLKDDEEFFRGDISPVSLQRFDGLFGIPISRRLLFNGIMDPGKYVFQLRVTDKKAKKKESIATQAIDFEILANN